MKRTEMTISVDFLIHKADDAFDRKDFSAACDLYKKATGLAPDNLYAWMSLSAAYFNNECFELALEVSERGLELFPEERAFAFNAGLASNMLYENNDAIKFYTMAIELDPEYAKAWYARGNCRLEWNEYEKAADDYQMALEHKGEFDDIHGSLGYCLEALGGYRNALDCYKKSLENGESKNLKARKGICHYLLEGSTSKEASDLLHEYYSNIYKGNREVVVYLAAILKDQGRYEELKELLETSGMEG